jgi:WD40 repeat protein
VFTAEFSPDGHLLVSGKADGTITLWDVPTRQPLGPALRLDEIGIMDLAFAPDGKTFASTNLLGTVVLWDVQTRQPLGSPFAAGSAGRIRFGPEGKVLAVLSADNKATFWDIASRRPMAAPISGDNGVALSKDFMMASIGNDSIVLRDLGFLADASRRSWRDRACARANRNLTRAEWQKYFGDEPYRATCPGLPLDEDTAPTAQQ